MNRDEIRNTAFKKLQAGDYLDALKARKTCLEHCNSEIVVGFCNSNDYPKFNNLIASLICYSKKQHFAYKAIEDNSKVGYLSWGQYLKYRNIVLNRTAEEAKEFLKKNGRMTTMYKLLKRAVEENPMAHWLKSAKLSESELEELSRVLQKDSLVELIESSVQDAYNVHIVDNRIGSGHRFATHSCMERDPVGKFYESFNCQAYIARKDNENIGRFLTWKTKDGETYIDRLYCNGGTQDDILQAIDDKWPNATKYPDEKEQTVILAKKEIDFGWDTFYPYVDSFPTLSCDGKTLFLSNCSLPGTESMLLHSASGHSESKFVKCEKCGKLVKKTRGYINDLTKHYMECEREYSSETEKNVYIALFNAFI